MRGTGSSLNTGVVTPHLLFIGDKAQALADNAIVTGIEELRVEGTLVLPTKGNHVTFGAKIPSTVLG